MTQVDVIGLSHKGKTASNKAGRHTTPMAEGVEKPKKPKAKSSAKQGDVGTGPQGRNRVHRDNCTATGHPVDVATGKLFTDFVDLELPGPVPLKLERVWYSTDCEVDGPLGHGWHHSYDLRLYAGYDEVTVKMADGREVTFPRKAPDGEVDHFDVKERLTLRSEQGGYSLTTAEQQNYHFVPVSGGGRLHQLAAVSNAVGQQIELQYDSGSRLATIVDSAGRLIELKYNAFGRVASLSVPHPEKKKERLAWREYEYDDLGNLVEVRDALGNAWKFAYQEHLLVQETNRNGLSFYFEWSGTGSEACCIHTWGDGGIYDHRLEYDEEKNETTVTNSLGHQTVYTHDGAVVTKVVDALGAPTETEYDEYYRVISETNALGHRSQMTYDTRGNLTEIVGPDGSKVTVEYDSHDLPLKLIDPVDGEWAWARDTAGRVLEKRDPLGQVTRYSYDGPWLATIADPAGGQTQVFFDQAGNVKEAVAPDGGVTRFKSDAWGRLTLTQDPQGNLTRRVHDLMGRLTIVLEPDGNRRVLVYDAEDNVIKAKDAHQEVQMAYGGMNRLRSRTEAGTTVGFEYDTEEQLTSITNEHGHVYRFVHGSTGFVEEELGFDGLLRRYTRDLLGRVSRVDRPGQRWSTYAYDRAGRVKEVQHSDGSSESYLYRADGELLVATNQSGSVTLDRDLLGRVIKESSGGHWVESLYNALGLRTYVRSSLGADLHIERNKMGDVTRVGEENSRYVAHFVRDVMGLEIERSLPGGLKNRWKRDDVGRPVEHTVKANENLLRSVRYTWEPNDRLKMVADALGTTTEYGHDERGNLAWAKQVDGTAELRMPDAVGNLFRSEDRTDREYGPAGQLLSSTGSDGTTRYAYDLEGNLIEKVEPNGRTWRYDWNGAGMMSQVTRPDGSVVRFEYDPLGRRIRKHYRGQTTHWVWDGNNPLHEWVEGALEELFRPTGPPSWSTDAKIKQREAELSQHLAQGPPVRGSKSSPITWLFEPDSFVPMAKLVDGLRYSIVTDQLGTPVLLADDRGRAHWSAQVSTYGHLRDVEGDRFACPFRWPGQYEDAEAGLYYNRFRYYDSEAGQYISQDPIGLVGGGAVYAYVADPLSWVDSTGLIYEPTGRAPADLLLNPKTNTKKTDNLTEWRRSIDAADIGAERTKFLERQSV